MIYLKAQINQLPAEDRPALETILKEVSKELQTITQRVNLSND
jgi:hypothetical protein